MQVSRAAKTSDPLGRYYTDPAIASMLVQAMRGIEPNLVLDLGAGSGALVCEAAAAWPNARFVTVDIDDQAASANLPYARGSSFGHHLADALDPNLTEVLGLALGTVDAAVCNPPYLKPRWLPHYADLLTAAGLAELGPKLRQVPADLLFIAQNLRLLRDGGRLGLIIPDGIVAGERFAAVRAVLLQHHRIDRVIELPRRIFKATDAKAHIVVLSKNSFNGSSIPVQRAEADGSLAPVLELTLQQAAVRMDYSFYAAARRQTAGAASPGWVPLRDLGAAVWRGRVSSSQRGLLDYPVFHTTDFQEGVLEVPCKFRLAPAQALQCPGTAAEAGDILVARIGRTLERKVSRVVAGPVSVSDSVLVLRLAPAQAQAVFAYLTSGAGRQALAQLSHGVAAKFITAGALEGLHVPEPDAIPK